MTFSSINAAFFLPFEAILFQRGRLKTYKFVPEGMYSGILAEPLFRNVETQRKLRLIQSNFICLGLILILKRCPSRNIYIAMYVRGCQTGMQGFQLWAEPRHFCKLDVATSRIAVLDLNLHVL